MEANCFSAKHDYILTHNINISVLRLVRNRERYGTRTGGYSTFNDLITLINLTALSVLQSEKKTYNA